MLMISLIKEKAFLFGEVAELGEVGTENENEFVDDEVERELSEVGEEEKSFETNLGRTAPPI